VNQGEGTVLELQDETLEGALSGRKLEELKDHLLVGSEHAALSNHKAKDGADLAGSTGHGNADWGVLVFLGQSG